MKLAPEYFNKIKNGDTIEFSDVQNEQAKIVSEIIALHRFPSFSELLDQFPIIQFGGENKEQMLTTLKKFYSEEDEKKYGVIGIEIKLIKK